MPAGAVFLSKAASAAHPAATRRDNVNVDLYAFQEYDFTWIFLRVVFSRKFPKQISPGEERCGAVRVGYFLATITSPEHGHCKEDKKATQRVPW